MFKQAPHMSLIVEPLTGQSFEDAARGRVDVAISGVKPPAPLQWQTLYSEDYACVVSEDHPVTGDRLELDDLARYPHVSVVALQNEVMDAQRQLIGLGIQPKAGLQVPYFAAAATALPGTRLIAILPNRFAERFRDGHGLRILSAPTEFQPVVFGLSWHPRLASDPAHTWLRELIHTAAATVADSTMPTSRPLVGPGTASAAEPAAPTG
jgi:DNA-binding transcriptional LysR family regulator